MKLAIIGAAAAAVAAIGLAGAPVAFADPAQTFLAKLKAGGFTWDGDAGGRTLIEAGHGVCSDLSDGAAVADLVKDGMDGTGWDGAHVGYFIGAAVASFCPEHLQRVTQEAKALDS